MSNQHDLLLRYAVALDAANFDGVAEVLKVAELDEGLEAAIFGIHSRFDSGEGFTRQLMDYRAGLAGREEPAS